MHLNGTLNGQENGLGGPPPSDGLEPIAIVGFAMRFPQEATNAEDFWKILVEGRSVMTEVPEDRFNIGGFYHPDPSRPDTINARGGHFIKGDIGAFDAPFFSLSPVEVESMDPQQRFLLETSYHALENAGIPMEKAAGSNTSVHVGCIAVEYSQFFDRDEEIKPMYKATGTGGALLSNRLSWFYDFKGPSLTLETACSSSLVALHLACQGLRSGEASMSLVAGTQLYLEPLTNATSLSTLGTLSSESRCFSFDGKADGYAKGEGICVVVLKTLSEAIAQGDTIRAVIRATNTNQDGRTPGITQPSQSAQEDQIRTAYARGGLPLDETRLFEAHGTGTLLGDPIEVRSIASVFQEACLKAGPMYVGALKSNIGHLEATAGLAGVLKVILCLEKGIIPPNAGFDSLNPSITKDASDLIFPTKALPWPTTGIRRASVNSFGYGGSNAHVVLDDAYNYLKLRGLVGRHLTAEKLPSPEVIAQAAKGLEALVNGKSHKEPLQEESEGREVRVVPTNGSSGNVGPRPFLFVWSASEKAAMARQNSAFVEYLSRLLPSAETTPQVCADIAYTLSEKRSILPWKWFISAASLQELQEKLEATTLEPRRCSIPSNLVYVFSGQGAQWARMGLELLAFPVFKQLMEESDAHFRSLGSSWSLLEELARSTDDSLLDNPALAQPICTAVQVALTGLLSTLGLQPQVVVGHSSGEIAGAYSAGVISAKAAWTIAYFRGFLAAEHIATQKEPGAMLSVQLSETAVQSYVNELPHKDDITVACVNSPANVTMSGSAIAVEALKLVLDADGVFCRKLRIPIAYHSPQMLNISGKYLKTLQGHLESETSGPKRSAPIIVSSVTGQAISPEELLRPEYWVRNLTSRVEFCRAVEQAVSMTVQKSQPSQRLCLVELGPHSTLQKPLKDTAVAKSVVVSYFPALRRGVDANTTLTELAGELFMEGHTVQIDGINRSNVPQEPRQLRADLPMYPFSRAKSYWLQSRLVTNLLQRSRIRHELFGLPSLNWNEHKPVWRHTLRQSDLPWMVDHQVEGAIVYPAAGMLVAVLEAARSISTREDTITGYRFRDVMIKNALPIPTDSSGAEIQLYMHGNKQMSGPVVAETRDFWLHSLQQDSWLDICSGTITVEYAVSSGQAFKIDTDRTIHDGAIKAKLDEISSTCTTSASSHAFYDMSKKMGYGFGPTFQTLQEISYDPEGQHAIATIEPDEWRTKLVGHDIQEHIIHPTTLDGVLQTGVILANKGGTFKGPLQAPTRLKEAWISHKMLSRKPSARILVGVETQAVALRANEASIVVVDANTQEPQMTFDGYQATSLTIDRYTPTDRREIAYSVRWRPDISLLSREQKEAYCRDTVGRQLVGNRSRSIVCFYHLEQALAALDGFHSNTPHINKYLDWAREHVSQMRQKGVYDSPPWDESQLPQSRDDYLAKFASKGPAESAIQVFSSQLAQMVRGEVDPLDLLFNGGLAHDFYAEEGLQVLGDQAGAIVNLMAHKNPNMSILEIGAGTGSVTDTVLKALVDPEGAEESSLLCDSYFFTDISPSFFEQGRDRFADYKGQIAYQVLDIEKDVQQQGFAPASYDLVIAINVLHATANMEETLDNVKALLKPGGQLLFIEPTNKITTFTDAIWGTLPGWWRGVEPDRQSSPLYALNEWDERLRKSGFTGLDLVSADYPEPACHTLSLLTSELAPTKEKPADTDATIVVTGSEAQFDLAKQLSSTLKTANCEIVTLDRLHALGDNERQLCICLVELEASLLNAMTNDKLKALNSMLADHQEIYWFTQGAGHDGHEPERAMSSGFGRAVTQENLSLSFFNINVENQTQVLDVFGRIFEQRALGSAVEPDYDFVGGKLHIPRIIRTQDINSFVYSQTGQLKIEKRMIADATKDYTEAMKLQFTIGQLDSFYYAKDESIEASALGDDEVEIDVKASGINFTDVMVMLGQVAGSYVGCEYCGVVRRVGPAVKSVTKGDRVCVVAGESFKTVVRVKEYLVARIPDFVPFTEAFPAVYVTAIYSICHLARIRPGESILIHSAAGAVGQAAIQLAQHLGAEVYVTIGTEEKRAFIEKEYGIPAHRIFSSRNLDFGRQIMARTNGRGIDVVLNSLSGQALLESWRILAPLGRFLEIGKRDIQNLERLPMQPFSRNVSYHSIDLQTVHLKDHRIMRELLDEMERYLESRLLTPPQPVQVFAAADIEPAIRYLQTGKHMGKAVINWESPCEIPVAPYPTIAVTFPADATYVISGGLGGLGRSLALWLVKRGVKNLILLSRSGPQSSAAQSFLKEEALKDVTVMTPRCDISDLNSLRQALDACAKQLPPIRGCFQGAMVLKDRIMQNMTIDEWQGVLDPKVAGTWNLHHALPRNLDFFVILSSVGGLIGTGGQAQYNAVSTFQDAFARNRWSSGEHCVSIDVGLIKGVGYVAERGQLSKRLDARGIQGLDERELFSIIEWAVHPTRRRSQSSAWDTQLITGVGHDAATDEAIDTLPHLKRPLYRHLRRRNQSLDTPQVAEAEEMDLGGLISSADGLEGAGQVITQAIAQRLSRALGVKLEDIDVSRPAYSHGVDSLVAVELRFWMMKEVKADVAVFNILAKDSIQALGQLAATKSQYTKSPVEEGEASNVQ